MGHMYVLHKFDVMQAMGVHYQATCFVLMILPNTSHVTDTLKLTGTHNNTSAVRAQSHNVTEQHTPN